MVSFEKLTKLLSFDLEGKWCIEIEFSVKGYPKYQSCWMGKLPDKNNADKELYWFGLVLDGTEGYGYDNFIDFSSAPVFGGKSLKEIWDQVDLLSIEVATRKSDSQPIFNLLFLQYSQKGSICI